MPGQKFTTEALADLLEDVAKMIRRGDSLEGSFEYRLPSEDEDDSSDALVVTAAIRVGNLGGQGGMMLVGKS